MNDQPKPASGEHSTAARETFQDIAPASGEWTACEHCKQFGKSVKILDGNSYSVGEARDWDSAKSIANAHNAALAAAWDKWQCAEKAFEAQRQQLAAERKKVKHWESRYTETNDAMEANLDENDQLRQQLAAEREKVATAEATIKEYEDYIRELDKIALEREGK